MDNYYNSLKLSQKLRVTWLLAVELETTEVFKNIWKNIKSEWNSISMKWRCTEALTEREESYKYGIHYSFWWNGWGYA
jgi:hypothetical protein